MIETTVITCFPPNQTLSFLLFVKQSQKYWPVDLQSSQSCIKLILKVLWFCDIICWSWVCSSSLYTIIRESLLSLLGTVPCSISNLWYLWFKWTTTRCFKLKYHWCMFHFDNLHERALIDFSSVPSHEILLRPMHYFQV